MRFEFLIACCLVMIGCASEPRTEYAFVADTAEGMVAAQAAADEWNACGSIRVSVKETGDLKIQDVVSLPDHPEARAWGTQDVGIRYVASAPGNEDLASVFAHEMGHVFGLHHAPDGSGAVMAGDDVDGYVTPADCAALLAR